MKRGDNPKHSWCYQYGQLTKPMENLEVIFAPFASVFWGMSESGSDQDRFELWF